MSDDALFGFDASEVYIESEEAEQRAKRAFQSTVSHLRRAAQFGMAFASATGKAMSMQYTMMIETALVTLDTIVQTQAAIAAGTFGVATVVQAALSGVAILTMIATIDKLRKGKEEQAAETQRMVQMFRIVSLTR
jgi:hypothetical protein